MVVLCAGVSQSLEIERRERVCSPQTQDVTNEFCGAVPVTRGGATKADLLIALHILDLEQQQLVPENPSSHHLHG